MSAAAQVLRRLGLPVTVVLATLLLSAVLLLLTSHLLDEKKADFQRLDQQIGELRAATQKALQDEQWMRDYRRDYQSLASQGVVGAENRLEWSESLKEVALGIGLTDLQFNIAQQQPFTGEPRTPDAMRAFQSDMSITGKLLHTGDLVRLIDGLRKLGIGLFVPQSCSLTRESQAPEVATISAEPSLQANCTLSWLTLAIPTGAAP